MKLSRKLVPAIAMLLVSAVMLSTASFAWFSMNTTVEVGNMQVQAQAMGSLVVSLDVPKATTIETKVEFADAQHPLTDAAKWSASPSGLVTIPEGKRAQVLSDTGVYAPELKAENIGAGKAYEEVAISSTSPYYYDYVFYLAARSTDITDTNDLQVTLTASPEKWQSAVAVDFYVFNDNNKDTMPTAGSQCKGTAHLDTTDDGNVVASIYQGTVPVAPGTLDKDGEAMTGGFLKVVMRVYIDGTKDAVNNDDWTAAEVEFKATFKLVPVSGS